MPLTLKDIARMAGVAESTVSRAVNNKPGVGEETRKKIMELVKEYNYQPNQLARGLAKKETHLIALIVADLSSVDYEIIRSIESAANKEGYNCIICNTDNNPEKRKTYLHLVLNNRVDGAIIIGEELADKSILNLALKKDGSLVLVNCLAEELLIPTLLVDNSRGAYLAVTHLLEQDLKNIAIVMGSTDDFLESEKLAGYEQALEEFSIAIPKDLVFETDGSPEGAYRAFLKAMDGDRLPDGFFVTSDILAVGLVDAIKTGGYLVPEDFPVVAYGDSLIARTISPSLTVVAEPLAHLGTYTAEYIISLIRGKRPDDTIKVLEPVLIKRESSMVKRKK